MNQVIGIHFISKFSFKRWKDKYVFNSNYFMVLGFTGDFYLTIIHYGIFCILATLLLGLVTVNITFIATK